MNSYRLRGPKSKYLHLAAKRYNCKICSKGFPSTLALYGHRHSHKFCLSRPQPLPPGVRHRGPKPKYLPLAAKLYNCKICNKGFPSTRAMYGHKHAHKVRPTRSQLLPHGVRVLRPPQLSGSHNNTYATLGVSTLVTLRRRYSLGTKISYDPLIQSLDVAEGRNAFFRALFDIDFSLLISK
ncbi:hypothetical protein ACE6H2_023536 [Prunus campanulata]